MPQKLKYPTGMQPLKKRQVGPITKTTGVKQWQKTPVKPLVKKP